MSEPILSPDGNFMWTGNDWIPAPPSQNQFGITDSVITGDLTMTSNVNINTRSPEDEIKNLADFALLKISYGDLAAAESAYNDAKKVNVKIAQDVFQSNKFGLKLGEKYLDVVEGKVTELLTMQQVTPNAHAIGGAVIWNIFGDIELSAKLDSINLSIDKSLSFLGPQANIYSKNTSGKMIFPTNNSPQLYRCSQLLKISGYFGLISTNGAFACVKGPVLLSIQQLREKAFKMSKLGENILSAISMSDLKSGENKMINWKMQFRDLYDKVILYQDWEEDLRIRKENIVGAQVGVFLGILFTILFLIFILNL